MTQHTFEQTVNGKTYSVMIGWDRPLQRFFGVIFADTQDIVGKASDFPECPEWSNLYFGDGTVSLETIVDACTERGIKLPDGLLENVQMDMVRNSGNEFTSY